MEYIFTFIIIFINSIALTIKTKTKIEVSIPISVIGIVLAIYVFGIFNKLIYGVIAVMAITLCCMIYIIYSYIKNRKSINIKDDILTPGVVVYALLYLIFVLFNKGILFQEFDEFSHWGLIVKNMYECGNFGIGDIIEYSEYPPFISIFQYFMLIIKRAYSEDTIIIALNILYASFIIPLLRNIKWDKSLKKLVVLIPIILLLPIMFYDNFYITLFMDGFLACMLAYVIYSWINIEEKGEKASVVLGCIAMALSKSIGIAYVIVAIIIFGLNILLTRKKGQDRKDNIKLLLIVIAGVLIFYGAWLIKLNISDANIKWNMGNISISKIKDVLSGNGEYYQKTTIKSYVNELFWGSGTLTSRKMNVINLAMFLIGFDIISYVFFIDEKSKKTFAIISIAMLIFWGICIFGLLLIFLFIFTPEEAVILACYERYLAAIPFAITIINIFMIEQNYKDKKLKTSYMFIILAIMITFVPIDTINKNYIQNKTNQQARIAYREKYTGILKYSDMIDKDAKVYYISNLVDGREITIVKYEFLPLRIGNKSSKLTMGKDEFTNILRNENYSYVFVNTRDRFLERDYKDLFENEDIEEKTMYKIIFNSNNEVLFSKVE